MTQCSACDADTRNRPSVTNPVFCSPHFSHIFGNEASADLHQTVVCEWSSSPVNEVSSRNFSDADPYQAIVLEWSPQQFS